jgi:fibronectin-binding autotransporter adhesin
MKANKPMKPLTNIAYPAFALFAMIMLSLSAPSIWAGSATWKSSPVDNQWYNPNNWTPATVPDGATDIATFGTTTQPAITISDGSDFLTVLNGITFDSGASAYILTVPATGQDLTFQGRGVANNSGRTQTFVINGRSNSTVVTFQDATAGSNVSYVMGLTSGVLPPNLVFSGSATAGSASFTCTDVHVTFNGGTTADNATFMLNTGLVDFMGGSSAGNGTFILNGGDNAAATVSMGHDGATAGNATFTVNGNATGRDNFVSMVAFTSAGAAVFTANGAVDTSHNPGVVSIAGPADPATATFIANPGLNGGAGGLIQWQAGTRNRARVEVFGSGNGDVTNGTMDISTPTPPTVIPIGSLEGTGLVKLGQNKLSVGSNNASTSFDGIINDAGGGSLTKTGSGTFSLSQPNTYTGNTTVTQGTLLVTNSTGSATGTGKVTVNGGVLGGTGTISGGVTIGSATRFGTISPGLAGQTGRVTIFRPITFRQFGIYNVDLDSTSVTADQVVARGVTIGSGATTNIADLGTGTLTGGTVLTLINNTSAIPINGTFSNLADGSTLTVGTNTYLVNYEGGTGNDLTLTVQ